MPLPPELLGGNHSVFVFLSTFFNHFNGVRWSHWRKLPMVNLYGLHFNMNVCLHFATAVVVLGMGIESVIYGSRIKGPLSPTWLSLWSMASSPSCWQVAGGQSQWFIPLINDWDYWRFYSSSSRESWSSVPGCFTFISTCLATRCPTDPEFFSKIWFPRAIQYGNRSRWFGV